MKGNDQSLLLLTEMSVVLFLAGFHFFCSLEGEFRFLKPKMLGYPGEFFIITRVNCLIIIIHEVKLKVDDKARQKL